MTDHDEVARWLELGQLQSWLDQLIEEGYDDLEAISRCTEEEMTELANVIDKDSDKRVLTELVVGLQRVGVHTFRDGKMSSVVRGSSISTAAPDDGKDLMPRLSSNSMKNMSNEGYISVKCSALFDTEDWVDRYFVLSSCTLQWKTSRKAENIAGSIALDDLSTKIYSINETTLELHSKEYAVLVLNFDSAGEIVTWFPFNQHEKRDLPSLPPPRTSSYNSSSGKQAGSSKVDDDESANSGSISAAYSTSSSRLPDVVSSLSMVGSIPPPPPMELLSPDAQARHTMNQEWHQSRASTMLDGMETERRNDIVRNVLKGCVLRKFKRNKVTTRLIRCTSDLSRLAWCNPSNGNEVYGFIKTRDIREIEPSTVSATRFNVVSKSRILELEAQDEDEANHWMTLLRTLLTLVESELKAEEDLRRQSGKTSFKELQRQNRVYLIRGSMLRHLNSRKSPIRFVYCTPDMDELIWKSTEKGKTDVIKGRLSLTEIVECTPEQSLDNTRFSIVARKAVHTFEAKDEKSRNDFIESMTFVLR